MTVVWHIFMSIQQFFDFTLPVTVYPKSKNPKLRSRKLQNRHSKISISATQLLKMIGWLFASAGAFGFCVFILFSIC